MAWMTQYVTVANHIIYRLCKNISYKRFPTDIFLCAIQFFTWKLRNIHTVCLSESVIFYYHVQTMHTEYRTQFTKQFIQ